MMPMMIGEYPCCGGSLMLAMPSDAPEGASLPAYSTEKCPHCGGQVWHRFSRFAPMSWTEADFLDQHELDLEARVIRPLPGTEAAEFDRLNRRG
jgi:hypothetical protein